jgi:hypothetical protein
LAARSLRWSGPLPERASLFLEVGEDPEHVRVGELREIAVVIADGAEG